MSARDKLRRYVNLLGDMWTPPTTTEARVERLYAAVRAEALSEAADGLVASCPDHGDLDSCFMDCHCDAADSLRRMAAEAGESA